MAKMVEDGWAGGEMNVGDDSGGYAPENMYGPELFIGDWKRTLMIIPKRSISGRLIGPFKMGYYRQREVYQNGQRLLSSEYLTSGEYIMMLLKREKR